MPRGASGFKQGVYYDTQEPHHTVRLVPASQISGVADVSGDILLVAGEAHDQGKRPNEYDDAYGKLEQWARSRFTEAGQRVAGWSYQVL